ncbi:MAG: hypothetical protein MR821_02225 [Clostridiales bacterium]|nr:hypothetical protein [Clostridiales bacterium]
MKIGEAYIQYSKIFTAVVGVLYAVQVGATIALVCRRPDAAEYLIDILSTTTGLFGLVFGCYTGNSVVEKVNTTRKSVSSVMQPGAGSDVG